MQIKVENIDTGELYFEYSSATIPRKQDSLILDKKQYDIYQVEHHLAPNAMSSGANPSNTFVTLLVKAPHTWYR